MLLYLYAIVDAAWGLAELLAQDPVPGIEPGEPLFTLGAERLLAVVSRVPASLFLEEPLNALLADLPRLAPYVLRHEDAVRRLSSVRPGLLPMSFGTVYRSNERVVALLRKHSHEFHALLERLLDKDEWGIKLFADSRCVIAAAEGATEVLRALAGEIAAASPGRAYLLAKRREQLLAGEARRLLGEAIDRVLQDLAKASASMERDQLPNPVGEGPQLVAKAAFLVERARAAQFRSLAGEIQRSCPAIGCTLELTGPWAPYSFVGEPRG